MTLFAPEQTGLVTPRYPYSLPLSRASEGGALMMAAVGRRRREIRDARVSNPIQQLCRGILSRSSALSHDSRARARSTARPAGGRTSAGGGVDSFFAKRWSAGDVAERQLAGVADRARVLRTAP
jgi:hypothetical protein